MNRSHKIYDAVHGFIHFNALEKEVIDSAPFQRLHHIHQLGIAYLVYPGATHTRFEHSLGTMYVATQLFERLQAKGFGLPDADYWMQIIRLAALCHDLGHLPFSHDAEHVLLGESGHEEWTYQVILSLAPTLSTLEEHFPGREVVQDVLRMAIGKRKLWQMGHLISFEPMQEVLSQVITGDFFGADRIDYLLRDAQCTGVSYGLFDYHQLIEMLTILSVEGKWELGIEENGVASCEALLLARHFMHQRVYQYVSVKVYKFHLSHFMQAFFAEQQCLKNLDSYLSISDAEVLAAIRVAARNPLHPQHMHASALLKRSKRFKAVLMEGERGVWFEEMLERLMPPAGTFYLEPASRLTDKEEPTFFIQSRLGGTIPFNLYSQMRLPRRKERWAYLNEGLEAQCYEHFASKGGVIT